MFCWDTVAVQFNFVLLNIQIQDEGLPMLWNLHIGEHHSHYSENATNLLIIQSNSLLTSDDLTRGISIQLVAQ